MKKILSILLCCVTIAFFTTSCEKEEDVTFDENLLIGKWKSGTLHERYDSDKTGVSWDTADDVKEEEGQKFTWTLVKNNLEQIHLIQSGGKIPKTYTVTVLNATTLTYEDNYGKSKTFSKIN